MLVPNYRLTSQTQSEHMFRHPGHAEDILDFLTFLETWNPPAALVGGDDDVPHAQSALDSSTPATAGAPAAAAPPPSFQAFDARKLVLIGHSCSAHMLASIFLDSDDATPSLAPPEQLREAVKGIAMSEGIYDIDLLLSTFPQYREWFIENAFGPRETYTSFDTTRYPSRKSGPQSKHNAISWLVLHSDGDTLVDVAQSKKMYEHLVELHRETEGRIFHDFETLKREHNEILRGDELYVKLIAQFVGRFHGPDSREQ